ncbi:mgtA regulatory leader peptide MgtL [Citrobacter amalonaticus]|uniref:mgtA leader peptide n=1 Tax=Citrobacter amalonaticus TaxID=35703 RepID=A0A8I0MJK9_CITAM|nr:mgtA regulatory leader peptide MgtL [Citrobacter amalonaticus]HAT6801678.1 mgtA regulatory leader peptide MgtL [Citrobacter freundii]ELK6624770.1 mgtA regulatory leader peptide MgtL [Citrobacter amalonaticus]MBE0128135.1 mgtA regulatory leader peptide MgtL [Citrobacter amalonaticus]MBJ9256747.1 mgtA regulatory leader peptide MgtL [Citrobacter amalonaticus]
MDPDPTPLPKWRIRAFR